MKLVGTLAFSNIYCIPINVPNSLYMYVYSTPEINRLSLNIKQVQLDINGRTNNAPFSMKIICGFVQHWHYGYQWNIRDSFLCRIQKKYIRMRWDSGCSSHPFVWLLSDVRRITSTKWMHLGFHIGWKSFGDSLALVIYSPPYLRISFASLKGYKPLMKCHISLKTSMMWVNLRQSWYYRQFCLYFTSHVTCIVATWTRFARPIDWIDPAIISIDAPSKIDFGCIRKIWNV